MSYIPSHDELRGHVKRLQAIEAYLKQLAGNLELRGRAADELVTAAGFVGTAIDSIQGRSEATDWLD